MSGYAFHPESFTDLDQLWEYIAEHDAEAADLRRSALPSEDVCSECRS
jgi:hypothetical protein